MEMLVWFRLTTGTGGEVLEWGPLHTEVSVSDNKNLVQDSSVVDEALEHTGRMDISQTPCAEDQRHLHRYCTDSKWIESEWNKQNVQSRLLTSWDNEPWATLVLQTAVNREKEEVFVGSVILEKAKKKEGSLNSESGRTRTVCLQHSQIMLLMFQASLTRCKEAERQKKN